MGRGYHVTVASLLSTERERPEAESDAAPSAQQLSSPLDALCAALDEHHATGAEPKPASDDEARPELQQPVQSAGEGRQDGGGSTLPTSLLSKREGGDRPSVEAWGRQLSVPSDEASNGQEAEAFLRQQVANAALMSEVGAKRRRMMQNQKKT